MATKKSPGIDKIPIRTIKDCLPAILPSTTSIINATFLSAQFLNVWKIAEVTPILLKDGEWDIPNNYRPISLLPVLSKVCERVAHNQLMSFFKANHCLSPKQCGNKKWNSTELFILQKTDAILEAIDKKQLTATVLLDMSKAFHSVNHGILLSRLQDIVIYCFQMVLQLSPVPLPGLLKFIMLHQPNFLQLAKCHKEASWDHCSLVPILMIF